MMDIFQYIANLCKSVVKARKDQNLQYNDMLNNLIEVSKEHPEMTEEIMYKTCIQFFSDGYETSGMVNNKEDTSQMYSFLKDTLFPMIRYLEYLHTTWPCTLRSRPGSRRKLMS